jgi:hypothetical protein
MWCDQPGRESGAPEVLLVPLLLTNRRPAPEDSPTGIGRLEDRLAGAAPPKDRVVTAENRLKAGAAPAADMLNGAVPAVDRLNGAVSA